MPATTRSLSSGSLSLFFVFIVVLLSASHVVVEATHNSYYYGSSGYYGSSSDYTTEYRNDIELNGETCFVQPLSFKNRRFDYDMLLRTTSKLPEGCSANDIYISKLYILNTCIQDRNLERTGCKSDVVNGTTVSEGSNSEGYRYNTSDSTAQCNLVFSSDTYNYAVLANLEQGTAVMDRGNDICAPNTQAYFYIQNNCAASTGSAILYVDVSVWTGYYNSCSSSSWYDDSSIPEWAEITIIVVISVFAFLAVCLCVRKRRQGMTQQVQMTSSPGVVPPPTYTAAGPGVYYNNGQQQQPSGGGYPYPAAPAGYPASNTATTTASPQPSAAVNQDAIWHAGDTVTGYPKV